VQRQQFSSQPLQHLPVIPYMPDRIVGIWLSVYHWIRTLVLLVRVQEMALNPVPTALPDTTLVARARAGSKQAFSELVGRHSAQVYGVSYKMLRNREDAEDNLQNVFIKAYRKIDQFEGKSHFSTWLVRIAINEAMMMLRKRAPEKAALQVDIDPSKPEPETNISFRDTHADPEREYIAKELASKALMGLNTNLRNTFVLHKGEGWTHPELAISMGIDKDTVKSRIFRARVRLRHRLQGLTRSKSIPVHADQAA
jgi:RNA polymerase sigma-70 factor, ECF subfamily